MTLKVIIGIILLLINVPVGWLGLTYFICYAAKTGKKLYYCVAFLIYAASWVLLGLGVYLCGEKYSALILNSPIMKYCVPVILIILAIYIVYNFKKTLSKAKSQKQIADTK